MSRTNSIQVCVDCGAVLDSTGDATDHCLSCREAMESLITKNLRHPTFLDEAVIRYPHCGKVVLKETGLPLLECWGWLTER